MTPRVGVKTTPAMESHLPGLLFPSKSPIFLPACSNSLLNQPADEISEDFHPKNTREWTSEGTSALISCEDGLRKRNDSASRPVDSSAP